jgi:formamidopyrimidine-DNA glycosylase
LGEVRAYLPAVPELPEVEVLVRSLEPRLKDQTIREVRVRRPKVLAPTSARELTRALVGGRFLGLSRRGKYLLFTIQGPRQPAPLLLVGHLGMTGRMYLQPAETPAPKHAAVVLGLGHDDFVFEDTRYFGRLTLDSTAVERLGPEPLGAEFTTPYLAARLRPCSQAVKVKLLDQHLVAGIGNIYASEALFRAGIAPRVPARRLKAEQVGSLWRAIRETLAEAIAWGSTVRLDFPGSFGRNRLFYYGSADEPGGLTTERLRVYDRAGQPCLRCGAVIKRLVQAGRGTYYCPVCQRR